MGRGGERIVLYNVHIGWWLFAAFVAGFVACFALIWYAAAHQWICA